MENENPSLDISIIPKRSVSRYISELKHRVRHNKMVESDAPIVAPLTTGVGCEDLSMDYFENIIKRLIEQKGYWVRQSVRVNITKAEKVAIGKHSIPRPEIDIVGYKAHSNELLIIEVKSFLDSPGVKYDELKKEFEIPDGRFKLFTCKNYRNIVFQRLVSDLLESEMVVSTPTIRFGLAAGKIYAKDESKLAEYFEQRNWLLYKPSDIARAITELEKIPYENDPYVISAKILLRNSQHVI